jgi:prevent-host-death family protein
MKLSADTVGAFEAKTKLGELLERVRQGAAFTITKHDQPVARLIGFASDRATQRTAATTELRALRARYTLGGVDVRALREEGRA